METDFKEMVKQNREIEERFAKITQHNETILNESIAACEFLLRQQTTPNLIDQNTTSPRYLKDV